VYMYGSCLDQCYSLGVTKLATIFENHRQTSFNRFRHYIEVLGKIRDRSARQQSSTLELFVLLKKVVSRGQNLGLRVLRDAMDRSHAHEANLCVLSKAMERVGWSRGFRLGFMSLEANSNRAYR
jgi:hypothetical protein